MTDEPQVPDKQSSAPDHPAAHDEPPVSGEAPARDEPPASDEPPSGDEPQAEDVQAGEPQLEEVAAEGAGRPRWSRRIVVLVAVLAVLAGGTVVILAVKGGGSCPPDGAVLKVAGRKVTADELDRRVEVLKALYGLTPPPESDKAKFDAFPRDLAKSTAVGLLIDEETDDRELRVADKVVRDALDRYIAETYPQGGRATFVETLGNQGISEAEVLAEFRRLLETRRLFDAVTGKVSVTNAEMEAAFAERKDRLAIPERRRLRHLVVTSEAEAKTALARLQRGQAFATVATEVSLDASTKAGGGQLGDLSAADLAPAFAQAAFAAVPGKPFGPVQTDFGWHVGVVEEITPGRAVTLDEVRDPLRQQLVGEERLALWRKFLGQRIAESDTCYAARFRPADPDAPPPDVIGGTPPVPSSPSGR